jgi:hypothetical protein
MATWLKQLPNKATRLIERSLTRPTTTC